MKTLKLLALSLPLAALLAAPLAAQEDGAIDGSLLIGVRSVDVSGTLNKYKEDFNYDDGPRLFRFDLKYIPDDALRKYVDRVQIDINNFGGDPYESLRLSVEKYGNYDFDFSRRKSTYFYQDIILPVELAGDPALAFAGDFHHYDFDRVQDRANFKLWINERAQFDFGFNRYTKKGESTTTLDISRDEFEFDKPVDESLNEYSGTFSYSWDQVTLVLEERYREYDNAYSLFLPGRSLGEDPEDATILDFYFLDQPYDYTSNDHIVRVVAKPNKNLIVRAQADLQSLDMTLSVDEEGAGQAFTGAPLTIDSSGAGGIDRDLELFDIDVTYRANPRWALLFGARQYTLDQQGNLSRDGTPNRGRWDIDTTSYEVGAQFNVSPEVTVAAGLREETRDLDFDWVQGDEDHGERVETDQSGYFASLGWQPVKNCSLNLELEDSSFDNPFALTSPTDRQRYKVRGRYSTGKGFSVNGSYSINDVENDRSGWDSSYDQFDVRFGYRKDALQASLGYSGIEIERNINQTVVTAPGFGGGVEIPFLIDYLADSTFVDGRIRYDVDDRWSVGGHARLYENDGSFALERDDYGVWAEVGLWKSYLLHLGLRTIDYNEVRQDFDDYDADIAEISIGYKW